MTRILRGIWTRGARALNLLGEPGGPTALLEAAWYTWILTRELRVGPLRPFLERLATTPPSRRPGDPAAVRRALDASQILEPLGRPSRAGPCLRLAVVRLVILRRLGIPAGLVVGVGKGLRPESTIQGHAWLTLDGRPYPEGEDPEREFTVLFTVGPGGLLAGLPRGPGRPRGAAADPGQPPQAGGPSYIE